LDACSRFIGVGRWVFALFYRHEFHAALRAIARMISYDFGMHRAGEFLHLLFLLLMLVLVIVLPIRVTEINCAQLRTRCECDCTDQN
jgi:hypothetical protein